MSTSPSYLAGKTAIITGISRGIGRALTLQLLEAGATVIGWGLTKPDYEAPNLHFVPCDVSMEQQVEQAMAVSLDISPNIHFLINNAGFGYFSPLEDFDTGKWRRMLDVNLTGAFLVSQAVVPVLKQQDSAHVVNISSIAGRVGMPQGEGYNASKFGLAGFSECLFHELRKTGVKVTTVYPGSVETNFFDDIPGFDAHSGMMDAREVAGMILHVLNTSPNFVVRELEMRPLNSKPAK